MRRRVSICVCLLLWSAFACRVSVGEDGVVYFLVSEIDPIHRDSFILPLTDPQHIAAADRIVQNIQSTTGRIVSARIDRGSGNGQYKNKDLLNPGRIWSWQVTEFFGFVDITAEIYDGWPGYLEGHLKEWLDQNRGIIGFWNYTVTRRVVEFELQ